MRTALFLSILSVCLFSPLGLIAGPGENSAAPFSPASVDSERPDPTCWISVESVLDKAKRKEPVVLVDLRAKADFERFRIPGSVNIPLFAVKEKRFLRSAVLVVFDEGYRRSRLEECCRMLRKEGLRIWALDGGLAAWRQQGAPLEGDPLAQSSVNRMPPAVFFEEKDSERWFIIDVSASKDPTASQIVPRAAPLPFSGDGKAFMKELEQMEAVQGSPSRPFLIFNEKGEHYDRLEQILCTAEARNVFFLDGGFERYKVFLEHSALTRRAMEKRMLKQCAWCPR